MCVNAPVCGCVCHNRNLVQTGKSVVDVCSDLWLEEGNLAQKLHRSSCCFRHSDEGGRLPDTVTEHSVDK